MEDGNTFLRRKRNPKRTWINEEALRACNKRKAKIKRNMHPSEQNKR